MKKENLIKFYQTYKLYIFPLIVALSSLFLIVFAIYPQTTKLLSNQQITKELANKSKFLDTKVLALEGYDEGDLSRKVGVAMVSYPTDKDYGNILGLLQQLAVQSGFSVNTMSLGSGSSKLGNADSYVIRLELQGPKALLETLLNNLESSPRLMRINNIDSSSSKASQSVSVALTVEVLYALPPQNFGKADSPLPEFSQKDEELITTLSRATSALSGSSVAQPSASSPRGKANPFE